jgi:hypothetical protein
MKPIWKNAPLFSIARFISSVSFADSAGGFSQNVAFFFSIAASSQRPVRIRRAHDHDRVDVLVVDHGQRLLRPARHVEVLRGRLRRLGVDVGERARGASRGSASRGRARTRAPSRPTPISPTFKRALTWPPW